MIYKNLYLIAISLCLVNVNYPQLLIVKQESGQFVPLNDTDTQKYGAELAQILLKYTWPTCIASNLTAAEQNELLTADIPYAEEKFVQKKITELVGKDNINIQVAWVPQCLYDLFCIFEYDKDRKKYKDEEKKIIAELNQEEIDRLKELEKTSHYYTASDFDKFLLQQIIYNDIYNKIAEKKAGKKNLLT